MNLLRRPTLRKRNNEYQFATWNVRTLFKPGALEELKEVAKTYKIDLIALQEIRWPNSGFLEQRNYSLYHSAATNGMLGTGFLISNRLRNNIIDFKPISDRMSMIRLKGQFYNITIINVHAPSEDKDDNTKNTFYNKLDKAVGKVPKFDMRLIIGDFNGKIGKEIIYQPIIGKHSIHPETSNNGTRMIELAAANNLKISSTYFPHKNIHKQTWKSPDGRTSNQIDHVLASAKHVKSITDIKSCRGANIDSDHYLVKINIRYKVSRSFNKERNIPSKKWNTDSLKIEEKSQEYQSELDSRLSVETNNPEENIDTKWENIKTVMVEAGEKSIGYTKNNKKEHWFDQECRLLIEKRNEVRERNLQRPTRTSEQEYKAIKKQTNRLLRKKKREDMKNRVKEIEEARQQKEIKCFYQAIQNTKKKQYKTKTTLIRNEDGQLLTGKNAVADRWAAYFQTLLNNNNDTDETDDYEHPNTDPILSPTMEEVEEAIKKLKNGKSPGIDQIPSELLKAGTQPLKEHIHELIRKIWEEENLPKDWKSVIVIPIHKKGDIWNCDNYRGISLISCAYKILANIIYKRLAPYAENIIGDYQCGFRKNRSTTDQIFSIKQILEKNWEYNKTTYVLFIDFAKAYDSINRKYLWKALRKLNLPEKLIRMAQLSTINTHNYVRIGEQLSKPFEANTGLKQGDALAPMLFNLALESVVREARIHVNKNVIRNASQLIAYADDIAILTRNTEDLCNIFLQLETAAKNMGLNMNEHKTKVMIADRRTNHPAQLQIANHIFDVVTNFNYLGSHITPDNNTGSEIQRRIILGNKCMFELSDLLKSRLLTRATKLNIYRSLILPVVTYGAETWTISKMDESKLMVFERKILRKIFGPIKIDEHNWRIRMNHELEELYNRPSIVGIIKSRRLGWLGHVQRMDDSRVVHQVLSITPLGKRPLGRPKLRWCDNVKEDLNKLNVTNWKAKASDRGKWKEVVEKAKTHLGL